MERCFYEYELYGTYQWNVHRWLCVGCLLNSFAKTKHSHAHPSEQAALPLYHLLMFQWKLPLYDHRNPRTAWHLLLQNGPFFQRLSLHSSSLKLIVTVIICVYLPWRKTSNPQLKIVIKTSSVRPVEGAVLRLQPINHH